MDDDRLLSFLAETLADPPPLDAVEAAYAAYGWCDLDAKLAQLIEDAPVEVVGFGDETHSRAVTFDADGATIELSIDNQDVMVRTTPVASRVLLRRPELVVEIAPDGDGRLRVGGLSGPVRFEVIWDGHVVKTPWMTL